MTDLKTISRFLRLEWILIAAFAAVAAAAVLRPAAPAIDPSKVATVDLEKVFTSLKRYESGLAKVKTLNESLESQVKAAESKVRNLQSDLENFSDGSKEQAEALGQLQNAAGELRAVQQFVGAKLEIEKARMLRDTYLAIKDAVRRLAEREGLDYILLDDSVVEMDPANASNTMSQISARRFLYASPKHDVTNQLIGLMNDEWKDTK
jgi:Skp family chaperone for outer membrane proteins